MANESPERRTPKGRRRANVPGGRTKRHEVWVSPEEEGELYRRALAQNVTIPRYLYECAMAPETGETASIDAPEAGPIIKALEREVRELRQANEILRKASAYFAQAELDRPFRK